MTQKLLGNRSEGELFVISAPAGTGKTTLIKMLQSEFPCVAGSISCTTRAPRSGEVPGVDYYFVSQEEFAEKIKKGDFLEYAMVFGNYYGTSKEHVLKEQKKGRHVMLVIDTQGAMQLKKKGVPAVFIFISPPSIQTLKERLFKRQTESYAVIEQRLSWAKDEMALAPQYNYHIVNDNLENAYQILRGIVIAEEHRTNRPLA